MSCSFACSHTWSWSTFSVEPCSYSCVRVHVYRAHGVTFASPWIWAIYCRKESGCECGGRRSGEGGRDALQPPAQWQSDCQELEESKSAGSITQLWPGEWLECLEFYFNSEEMISNAALISFNIQRVFREILVVFMEPSSLKCNKKYKRFSLFSADVFFKAYH